jgi:hypothetical protein
MLSEKDIKEFQHIYFQTFGKKISSDLARQEAVKLIDLMRIITGSLSGNSRGNFNHLINKHY